MQSRLSLGAMMAFALAPGCVPQEGAAPPQPGQGQARTGVTAAFQGQPTLWQIPSEITYTDNGPLPAGVGEAVSLYQPYLDQFSWRMFIAVNWPSLPNGKPHEQRWIGAGGDAPAVWEHWMNADNLFRKGGEPPLAWGATPPIPPECKNVKIDAGITPVVFTQDDESHSTHNDPTLSDKSSAYIQAGQTGPLIDQKGRWARFEVYVNDVFYDYVKKNELYSREGQKKFKDSGQVIEFPAGTIEIKVAWKILDAAEDKKKYHVAQGIFVKPDGACEKVPVGLVAMHVSADTSRNPNRVWSTFEHSAALCERLGSATGYRFRSGAFCNSACLNNPSNTSCGKPNTPPPKPWIPPPNPLEPGTAPPTQVVRTDPIPVPVGQLNSLVQSFLGSIDKKSVWANYQLIGTQWVMALVSDLNTSVLREWLVNPGMGPAPQYVPRLPGEETCTSTFDGFTRKCLGYVQPNLLASALIETYIQPGSSCVGCHEQAKTTAEQGADYAFVLQRAQGK